MGGEYSEKESPFDDQEKMLIALNRLNERFSPGRGWFMAVTACQVVAAFMCIATGIGWLGGVSGFVFGLFIGLVFFALFFDKVSPFFGDSYVIVVRSGRLVLVKKMRRKDDSPCAKYNPRTIVFYVTTPGWFRLPRLRLNWASIPGSWTNWDDLEIAFNGTITLRFGKDGDEYKRGSLLEIVHLVELMTAPQP